MDVGKIRKISLGLNRDKIKAVLVGGPEIQNSIRSDWYGDELFHMVKVKCLQEKYVSCLLKALTYRIYIKCRELQMQKRKMISILLKRRGII